MVNGHERFHDRVKVISPVGFPCAKSADLETA